jgi:hypothetical protein
MYSMLIAHLNTNRGGLGLLNASHKAAPNFVINIMTCRQRNLQGFQIKKDTTPIYLHDSIAGFFDSNNNPTSDCLTRYFQLLPHIARICCPPNCTENKHIQLFESQISQHSARGRLKTHCGNILTGQLYNLMATQAPEHLHLLPGILYPQTSYPLVDMIRSKAQHQLPDWTTLLTLRRKLRLPIYNTNNTPTCKCGKQHDCWGNHTFHCKLISKTFAHNIIQDLWASALQPALSTAGYIHSSSILDIEKKHQHF